MTVREVLSMCKNVNYGRTRVTVYGLNRWCANVLPADLGESWKRSQVRGYSVDGYDSRGKCITHITIEIER